jgi:hypothetical protein
MITLSDRIASLKEALKEWQQTKETINLSRLCSQNLLLLVG